MGIETQGFNPYTLEAEGDQKDQKEPSDGHQEDQKEPLSREVLFKSLNHLRA